MDFASNEEILDILFDKDDPLLKDVDYYLGDNVNSNFDELKSNVFEVRFNHLEFYLVLFFSAI